jgi:hypothetical protein
MFRGQLGNILENIFDENICALVRSGLDLRWIFHHEAAKGAKDFCSLFLASRARKCTVSGADLTPDIYLEAARSPNEKVKPFGRAVTPWSRRIVLFADRWD